MPVAAGITHTRRLDELQAGDDGSFGGKSAGLGELLRAEIPVPPGFALSTSAFMHFLEHSGLADRAADALAGVSADDYDAVAAAAHVIGEALRGAALPEPIREEVGTRYAELAASVGAASPPVAVRSSALGEDGGEATFAGQQDTYLWVRGADDICNAVRTCWVSLYSTEAISYRMRLAGAAAERPAMGVTVQLMVDAAVSGVMFTCNPVSGDPSMIAINASWGLGLAVVGGEVTPDDYLVSKITREVVRERINAKQVEYLPAEGGRGTHRVEIEPARQTARCLDDHTRETLVDLGRRIERHFGGHQDVEWALARGHEAPEGLFVLQSRPVTALPTRTDAPAQASALSLIMSKFGAA
jgi:pyruvate, water dikinase